MAALDDSHNSAESEEFPPLLPIGRHELSVRRIRELCVDHFPDSGLRPTLMEVLEDVIARLKAARVRGELWIGGSFVTEKPDPADVDIVLRMRSTWLEDASAEQLAGVNWIVHALRHSEQVDNYALVEWPRSHENYWVGEYRYAYWLRQWDLIATTP